MINFKDFPDYLNWSNHWVNLLSSFVDIEKIKDKDELKSKVRELILSYDHKVWASYRSGSMKDISYEDKYFQLAYLFRYYPIYANTLSYINREESADNDIDMLDDCFTNSKNEVGSQKIKLNISIFGGGSAPEAYAITKMICQKLNSSLWNYDFKLSECDLHFSIFDKDEWNIGRTHTKKLLRDFEKEINENKGSDYSCEKLSIIFEEKKFNIKTDTLKFTEKQDFMIYQFSLTELRDLLGPEKLTNFIEETSYFLNQEGKLVLLERSHKSTPKDFFGLFEEKTNLKLLSKAGPLAQFAQNYSEIPSFVMNAYSEAGQYPPKYNRFEYFIFKQVKTEKLEDEETISKKNLETGDIISHDTFGIGTVLKLEGKNINATAQVFFEKSGTKWLSLPHTNFSIIEKWWKHIDPIDKEN